MSPASRPPAMLTGMKTNFISLALRDPADQKADDDRRGDRKRQWVVLRGRGGARARLLRAARRRVARPLLDRVDLLASLGLRFRDPLLGLPLDVGLAAERLDRVAELDPRLLDVAADLLGALGL